MNENFSNNKIQMVKDNSNNVNNNVINNPFANMNSNNTNNNNKKYKIALIVGGVIILSLILYIIISKSIKPVNKEIKQKENLEEISLELTDYIANNNLDSLDLYGKTNYLRVAINDLCYGVKSCNEIEGIEVTNYIKRVFDRQIELEDVQCESNDGAIYSYDKAKETYIYNANHETHSLKYKEPILTKINSIRKKDNQYVLTLNKLYFNSEKSEYITTDPLGINSIYKFEDYDMPDGKGNEVIDMTKLTTDYENNYDRLKNKGDKYQYTFEKKGTNYVLKKYDVINLSKRK